MPGIMINIVSFKHPHIESLLYEGLWGFPLGRVSKDGKGINERKWEKIQPDTEVLIYGEYKGTKGVWLIGRILSKVKRFEPIKYWTLDPTGYPLQIYLEITFPKHIKPSLDNPYKLEWLDKITPIKRSELLTIFGLRIFRAPADRWSLIVFGNTSERGVTYSYDKFKAIYDEFRARNLPKMKVKIDHDTIKNIIYQIGLMQGKYPDKEYPIEDQRIDVVWRKTSKSVPYIAFEIHIKGNIFADLAKLKHAYDLWNSKPVLITTKDKVDRVTSWVKGTFHEIAESFKVITIDEILEYYEMKRKLKDFEKYLGIM